MEKKLPIALDAKDRMILYQLDQNSRQSYSEIGKKVKMPKNVVAYRVKRLMDEGIINGFYTIINVAKLGYMYIRLFISIQNGDEQTEKEIADYFIQKREVSWISKVGDDWNFVVVLLEHDITRFRQLYDDFLYHFNDKISEREVSIATEVYHFKNKFLFDRPDSSYCIVGGPLGKAKLDKIDVFVLNKLSTNARVSVLDIAKVLHISPKTVAARIKRLKSENIILDYRCRINYEVLGYQHSHISLIFSRRSKELEKKFFSRLAMHQRVVYITKAIGRWDLEFEILTKDQYERYKILNELKKGFEIPIKSVEIIPTYGIYDIKYSITE